MRRRRGGGAWTYGSAVLRSSGRDANLPVNENNNIGFRVASVSVVPEPTSTALLALGGLAVMLRRKRG